MQLVERHLIKPNHELYATLDDLTFKAKDLYNHGLYLYRQSYFEHKSTPDNPVLSWVEIDKSLRKQGHADIRALPSKVANAVLKNLGENISSFWKLVRLKRDGRLAQKPKLPGVTRCLLIIRRLALSVVLIWSCFCARRVLIYLFLLGLLILSRFVSSRSIIILLLR